MNGLYTEQYVKQILTPTKKLAKGAIIVLDILLFMSGIFLGSGILSILGVGGAVALYFVLPMFSVDYEYVFVDGQIDFDRITNGEKRKHMFRTDLDNVEIMAPEKSHRMDSYRNQVGLKIRDYSSGDPNAVRYALFVNKGPEKSYVIFEPSEKMIDFSKQKAPRKVFTD